MSIASRITSIEEHIGDIYSVVDYIKDTTGINKNLINIPTYLIKGYLDIINNGIDTLYNNFPKVSGIGSNLSLTPTYKAPIKLNEIQGNTLQENTPTPSSPVPIQSVTGLQNVSITGKNLLDISTLQYGYIGSNGNVVNTHTAGEMYSNFIKVQPSTTYTFKIFETSSTYNNWFVVGEYSTNDQSSFIIRDTMTTATQNYITFTTNENAQYVRVSARNLENATKVQLEKGSTATTYEPYKGNTYEVNLGKNLLDLTDGTYSDNDITAVVENGKITLNGTASATSFITIPLLNNISLGNANKTLSLNNAQVISDTSTECRLYTSGQDYNSVNFSTINKSTTFSNDRVYTRFQIRTSSGVTFNNFVFKPQLEKGTQATSYSPYFTPIELNKIGDYQDSIKKSTGKNLFDGTIYKENYVINSSGVESYNTSFNLYKISLKPNTTYTIQFKSTDSAIRSSRYIAYKNDGTFISMIAEFTYNAGESVTQTFTTPNETSYILYHIGKLVENVMLEQNSQATTYEPYGKVWYITENIQNWSTDSPIVFLINGSDGNAQSSPDGLFQIFTSNLFTNFRNETMLSSKFKYHYDSRINANVSANTYLTDNTFCIRQGTNDRVYFKSSDLANKSKADVLSTLNSLDLSYVLSTPIYEVITNTELIEQLESLYNAKSKDGTTNINVTSEDLSMILNVGVLKGE